MHVSFTVLGSTGSGAASAAANIADYLEGQAASPLERAGSAAVEEPLSSQDAAVAGGYYADSAESPGRWFGADVDGRSLVNADVVDPAQFERLLLGQHPTTGEPLVGASGSAGRAKRGHSLRPLPAGVDPVPIRAVAEAIGVDGSYLRRLALAHERDGLPDSGTWLAAGRDAAGHWVVDRAEIDRFVAARTERRVVLGYDVTFSVPKSVSLLWAVADQSLRSEIDAAIDAASDVGLTYLRDEAFDVRKGRGREAGEAMTAAVYRHHTNRALEPQLHDHAVIANVARDPTGGYRAVDARGLLAHSTTAGYLAGSELRSQLTRRLGVGWHTPERGLADIDGIARSTIDAMSSRRAAVMAAAEEFGSYSPKVRQMAALVTRPGKDTSVESSELQQRWREQLAELGLRHNSVAELASVKPMQSTVVDRDEMFAHLSSRRGVTEQTAVFDRRDVIQAVAGFANDRLDAAGVLEAADAWLATENVIEIGSFAAASAGETIGKAGSVSLTPDLCRYTTPEMVDIERRVLKIHDDGLDAGRAAVPSEVVEQAISSVPAHGGHTLGSDQAEMVRSITTSGSTHQAVVGLAGAGKTTAFRAATEAWHECGHPIIGLAPTAAAAHQLSDDTGIEAHTVAWLLTRVDNDGPAIVRPGTVIVVDEASMLSNRDLASLCWLADESGAVLRTIGDPMQHGSVEAGGLWAHIVEAYPAHTPRLDTNRRQLGDNMAEVRLALEDYRSGLIGQSLERLDSDGRVFTSSSWELLLDSMATDWFVEHDQFGPAAASPMIAERNVDRHALNARAQDWLRRSGAITDRTAIGGVDFHIGDRVITQNRHPSLMVQGGGPLINGALGTVTAITQDRDLVVSFDDFGEVVVDRPFIEAAVGLGRGGGLTPAYAITSFKAEGRTYGTARVLAAPGSIDESGGYVGLTRGRHDLRLYTIAPENRHSDEPELPTLGDQRSALEALGTSLSRRRGGLLATVALAAVGKSVEQRRSLTAPERSVDHDLGLSL